MFDRTVFPLRLQTETHEKAERLAEIFGVSLEAFILEAVHEKILQPKLLAELSGEPTPLGGLSYLQ